MNRRNAEPLDDETTIRHGARQPEVGRALAEEDQAVGRTSKKSLKEKVLLLESFFARVFDPVHFTAFPDLAEAAITCEDGGDDEPGCGAEFYAPMPHCPFCTHSASHDPPLMSDDDIAAYLIKVEGAKVRGPGKAQLAVVKAAEQAPKKAEAPAVHAIAPVTNAPIATVEELDHAVERAVTNLCNGGAETRTKCAIELKEIHERQLWRQRRGSSDQPKYAHFNNFVEAELAPRGIGRASAYGLIDMAKKFTRAEFDKLGPAKMNVILSLEEGPRKQLAAETVEQGALPRSGEGEEGRDVGQGVDRSDTSSAKAAVVEGPARSPAGRRGRRNATPEEEQVHTVGVRRVDGHGEVRGEQGLEEGQAGEEFWTTCPSARWWVSTG
jgi:hypothetical protein